MLRIFYFADSNSRKKRVSFSEEETKVAHAIFQVGDTLNTHTEGITRIDIAVDTASLKVMRVNHTAT